VCGEPMSPIRIANQNTPVTRLIRSKDTGEKPAKKAKIR
jgi:hypothetical protein